MKLHFNFFVAGVISLVVAISGCTPGDAPTETEPTATEAASSEPVPSLKETLQKTSQIAAKLNQGFADGAGHDVIHDPLHEISHLLDALPKQISGSDLSDENKKGLTAAVDTLMDCYGKIDAKFHGGEGAEFADVKDKVTEALGSLDSILGSMN